MGPLATNGAAPAPVGFDFSSSGELAALTQPPAFDNVDDERAYLKERLCAAIRIFAREGLDHGGECLLCVLTNQTQGISDTIVHSCAYFPDIWHSRAPDQS